MVQLNFDPPPTPSVPFVPSVLDRLLHDEPENPCDAPRLHEQALRELRQSVRRDLENLLNTRQWWQDWPSNLYELRRSLLTYGIPDITELNLASASRREEFVRLIEDVNRRHEPRLESVRFDLLAGAESLGRILRIRIDARLHAEPVVFDAALDVGTGTVATQEGGE
jgi:type VI secretion system protein ImpF